MADSKDWFTSMFSSAPQPGDLITTTPMNITKVVSIIAAGTVIVVQILDSTTGLFGTEHLPNALKVTLLLGVLLLIVAMAVTDMICRAYTTAHSTGFQEKTFKEPVSVDVISDGSGYRDAEWRGWVDEPGAVLARIRYKDDKEDTWVPLTAIRQHS